MDTPKSRENGNAQNIEGLSIGLCRYSNVSGGEDHGIWFLTLGDRMTMTAKDAMLALPMSVRGLVDLKRFIERAIETVNTDGNRLVPANQQEKQ